METDGSLPCSQHPTTDAYPEPDVSVPHYFPKIHSNIILSSTPYVSTFITVRYTFMSVERTKCI